jgi:hypothetical protein
MKKKFQPACRPRFEQSTFRNESLEHYRYADLLGYLHGNNELFYSTFYPFRPYLCVPYGSHNKERLFPQTALTGWAL